MERGGMDMYVCTSTYGMVFSCSVPFSASVRELDEFRAMIRRLFLKWCQVIAHLSIWVFRLQSMAIKISREAQLLWSDPYKFIHP